MADESESERRGPLAVPLDEAERGERRAFPGKGVLACADRSSRL
jgi:hypothetical protein